MELKTLSKDETTKDRSAKVVGGFKMPLYLKRDGEQVALDEGLWSHLKLIAL